MLLRPPQETEPAWMKRAVRMMSLDGWDIYRVESESGYEPMFWAHHVHKADRVWLAYNKAGVAVYRWRCNSCGGYLSHTISHQDARQLPYEPEAGPDLETARLHYEAARTRMHERAQSLRETYLARQDDQRKREYAAYLMTPAWRARRDKVLKRAGGMCEGCGDRPAVQVHHLTYRRIFREMLFDLRAVCRECHEQIHEETIRCSKP